MPIRLGDFPAFLRNAAKYTHADGNPYLVDEATKAAILKLEALNNEIMLLTNGKVRLQKLRSPQGSSRRTTRLGELSFHVAGNIKELKFDPSNPASMEKLYGLIERNARNKKNAKSAAAKILPLLKEINSPHSLLFDNTLRVDSTNKQIHSGKAWIGVHNPEELPASSKKKSSSVLASGATGEVRFLQDPTTGAMKVMKEMKGKDRKDLQKAYDQEMAIMKKLNREFSAPSRNIDATPAGSADDATFYKKYIIMDYLGFSAADGARQNSPTGRYFYQKHSAPLVALRGFSILAMTAAADLTLLHQNNILHRDIKPLNMTVDEKGTVKLIDFERAVILEDGKEGCTDTSQRGTTFFLDPEIRQQLKDKNVAHFNRSTDIYSFGMSLAEMLPTPSRSIPVVDSNTRLAHYAFPVTIKPEFLDSLPENARPVFEKMVDMINQCIQPEQSKRPSAEVLQSFFKSNALMFTQMIAAENTLKRKLEDEVEKPAETPPAKRAKTEAPYDQGNDDVISDPQKVYLTQAPAPEPVRPDTINARKPNPSGCK